MNRPRDRASAAGLLPRMEARPWRDGKTVTYRYHPIGGTPLNLGTDRAAAIQAVLAMNLNVDDEGTLGRLWAHYQATPGWAALKPRTQEDYRAYSIELLGCFGEDAQARGIYASDVAHYLRVKRGGAPVRANREVALLGNLMALAIERGEAEHNPCRGGQVPRNKERPRTEAPDAKQIAALVAFARSKGRLKADGNASKIGAQWAVITMAAEFAALAGSRQAEFLDLRWSHFDVDEVRLTRAKQRAGVVKVERIAVSPALLELRGRLFTVAVDTGLGNVFPNRQGNPYTASGFAAMWGKLMREALAEKVIDRRFTFHDLRAFYTTQHKERTGSLPDLHASPTTTARVYERSGIARRKSL